MTTTLPETVRKKGLEQLDAVRAAVMQPPPSMSVPEWADTYRRLSKSAGAIGGPWRTSRVEVARGPMLAVKERGVKTITAMTCTQLMKTSLLENVIGYFAHLDPAPMLLAQPKDDTVKAFSKERLIPMARATPVLTKLLGSASRSSGDTIGYKEFPGGYLALVSAGSPTNLAMRPIRVTLLDEIDKYETTKEGDPVLLAEERTSTFDKLNSLHIRTCSPTWEETSRIYKSYLESDQRRAYVACPHCRYEQTLDFFKHVHWSKSEEGEHFPFTAIVICESCGKEWTEAQRLKIMTTEGAIKWKQTRPFECCGVKQKPMETRKWKTRNGVGMAACSECGALPVPNTHAGFTASKLYSPFITTAELAKKWIDSKDDPESKQTFYNTQLGQPFKAQTVKVIEEDGLSKRREIFNAEVPFGVLVLTAGIDVQSGGTASEGRVEIETVGWGLGEESWSIDHTVIFGDPGRPELWAQVDEYLLRKWKHESGNEMSIRGVCVDSGGHNTEDVYKFARARVGRNVWAIKGANDVSGQWSPVWPIPKLEPRVTRLQGYRPIILGVNAAKESIRQKLLVEEPGSGYCHFPPERTQEFFAQLTSERLVLERKGNTTIRKWVLKKGHANEGLDIRVYAYGALCGLYATRKLSLERIAAAMGTAAFAVRTTADAVAQTATKLLEVLTPEPAPPPQAPAPPRPKVRRSSFMG